MQGVDAKESTPYEAEIAVMRHMHWNYADLMAAPAVLVETILERLAAESHWRTQKEKFDASRQTDLAKR